MHNTIESGTHASAAGIQANMAPMVLVGACQEKTRVPYDPTLLAFVHEDMEIRNPYLSTCGRLLVNPVEAYGFTVSHTGGGCMALDLQLPNGRLLRLVQDGAHIAEPQDWALCTIFLLDAEGEDLAYCDLCDVPMPGDEVEGS